MSGEINRAAVPSVSHKLGLGRSQGTLSWDEQREEGKKQLFSVFLLCFFTLFSEAVISFCHALFFVRFVFKGGNALSVTVDMDEMKMCSLKVSLSLLCPFLLFLGTFKALDFFISPLGN